VYIQIVPFKKCRPTAGPDLLLRTLRDEVPDHRTIVSDEADLGKMINGDQKYSRE
jgi:hypothetical protein